MLTEVLVSQLFVLMFF